MKFIIDYSKLQEPIKSQKALQDLSDHIGKVRYDLIVKAATEDNAHKDYIRGCFEIMLNVQGFPVEAFLNKYYPEKATA